MELITYLLGVLVGILICAFVNTRKKAFGTLRIDRSNPEKHLYRFEIDDLAQLSNKKSIVLNIDNNADLSQK